MELDYQKIRESVMTAKKRTSLDSIFGSTEPVVTEISEPSVDQDSDIVQSTEKQPKDVKAVSKSNVHYHKPRKATKQGKRPDVKQQTAYLPHAVYEQLRKLAFEEERKMHDYIIEGLDRVFKNRGLPSIEEITRKP